MDLIPAAPAPDFRAIQKWVNSEPISIKDLKGKVILLDCWTYTCIFCLRTIPIMKRLQEKYQKYGLQIIQAHSAEYEFARDDTNIHNALSRYDVRNIPVAFDSENKTWEAYGNSYWPKHVLIDQNNFVRYEHAGYGEIKDFEVTIRELLSEEGQVPDEDFDTENPVDEVFDTYGMHFSGIAPEICVGYSRLRRFGNNQTMKPDVPFVAVDPNLHVDNVVYLHGKWIWQREGVKACGSENQPTAGSSSSISSSYDDSRFKRQQSSIIMRYNSAKRVHGIVGPSDNKTARIEVKLDKNYLKEEQLGKDMRLKDAVSYCDIQWPFIHNLVRTEKAEVHEIEIIPKTDNVVFYTFVFG
jgi:thiol-disulfide isomerase/thioredoxin